jgi:hypothetical protein
LEKCLWLAATRARIVARTARAATRKKRALSVQKV